MNLSEMKIDGAALVDKIQTCLRYTQATLARGVGRLEVSVDGKKFVTQCRCRTDFVEDEETGQPWIDENGGMEAVFKITLVGNDGEAAAEILKQVDLHTLARLAREQNPYAWALLASRNFAVG